MTINDQHCRTQLLTTIRTHALILYYSLLHPAEVSSYPPNRQMSGEWSSTSVMTANNRTYHDSQGIRGHVDKNCGHVHVRVTFITSAQVRHIRNCTNDLTTPQQVSRYTPNYQVSIGTDLKVRAYGGREWVVIFHLAWSCPEHEWQRGRKPTLSQWC